MICLTNRAKKVLKSSSTYVRNASLSNWTSISVVVVNQKSPIQNMPIFLLACRHQMLSFWILSSAAVACTGIKKEIHTLDRWFCLAHFLGLYYGDKYFL